MRTSFRAKLLFFILVVVILTLSSTMIAVLRATNSNVTTLVGEELKVVQRVFLSLLDYERNQLQMRAELLAGDFAFKRAVATGDRETIVTALANHGDRIDADLLFMLSSNFEVLMSTHRDEQLLKRLRNSLDNRNPRSIKVTPLIQGEPFTLVLVPVVAPDLIGWIGLGIEVDKGLLDRLREITGAEITLVYGNAMGVRQLSTLASSRFYDVSNFDSVREAVTATEERLKNDNWLSETVVLDEIGQGELIAILSSSLDTALTGYSALRLQMILIAVSALALAVLTTILVSRWVTRPIYRLVTAAKTIADGNYSQQLDLEADEEFRQLGDALNIMQGAVADREARISHQAQHDMVTQLPNRNYIKSRFNSHVTDSLPGSQFGLCLLQLSNLAHLTDLYGSDFSDDVLKKVAERLSDNLRRGDLAARVADNQILLFYDDLTHDGVAQVAHKLIGVFAESITVRGVPVRAELWLGFILCPQHGQVFDDVLRRAQIALAFARTNSHLYAVYQIGQDEKHLRQIQVANRLQVATKRRQFTVLYQPKYQLGCHRVEQAEALVRWTDDELGQVFPDEFIPLAEQIGIISKISDIVLDIVLAQQLRWREAGLELAVCVNLSGLDVLQESFVRGVIERLHQSGLPNSALVMEITETALVADMELALKNLALFEAAGIEMSIDDFGTGYSSLAQLKALPVQELKIDKSLIQELDTDSDDKLIVRSTVEMAHFMGLKVVAEGVESLPIVQILHGMSCDSIQGYYLAKPMPGDELQMWLAQPPSHVTELRETLNASD
tara:strand:+ start:996 stop:3350 length:2355 start_codon:yes stop_codon:yes gene_type:complete